MNNEKQDNNSDLPNCAVSSRLNFTIGVIAIAAATAIGYLAWRWLVL
jgi:hypothetical protein